MSLRFKAVFAAYGRPAIAGAIGLASLLARAVTSDAVAATWPRTLAMRANSAVALCLLATALLLRRRARRLALATAAVVTAIGLVTVSEYLFGWDCGVDDLLFAGDRMALNAALALTCLGVATVLLEREPKPGPRPAQVLAFAVFVLLLPPAVIYLLGASFSFGIAPYALMSVPGCIAFALLASSVLRAHPDATYLRIIQEQGPGRSLVRNLGPGMLIVTVFVGWLVLRGESAGLYDAGFSVTLAVIFNILALVPLIFLTARSLNKARAESDRVDRDHRSLIETLPLMIWTADASGKVTFRNRQWETFAGAGAATALDPEDQTKWATAWAAAIASGQPVEAEVRLRRVDGAALWYLIRAVPEHDETGSVRGWLGTATDIDVRRRAESERMQAEALRASEERHRAIVENAFDAVVSTDAQGRITDWNHKAEVIFGWKWDEVAGRSLAETILPAGDRSALESDLRRFLATGQQSMLNRLLELKAVRRSGDEFEIQLSISPVPRGKSFTFTAFVADITDRKRNERELIDARQDALAAVKAKSAFLANMSHEIRTPLNGVIGMADLLLDTPLDDTQRRYARVMQDSGAGLLTIVNDILDFSKIEAGKLDLEMLEFNLASVVEGQVELLAGKARERNLSLNVFVDPTLPHAVTGDAGRIGQVLLNLIGNALKFTHAGGVIVNVTGPNRPAASRPGITCDGIFLRFEVKDTGVGLAPQTLSRLFVPFVQADGSTARQYGGTGLGLSICKRLVEMMGGQIGVESEPGSGSTFWFTLQLAAGAADVGRHEAAMAGARVLLVDADAASRSVLLAYLRSWNVGAEAVSTHESAIAALLGAAARGQAFDLAIIDAPAGHDEAMALATRIKATTSARSTRLLLATAIGARPQEAAARSAGFRGFLARPIKQSDLFDTLVDAIVLEPKGVAAAPATVTPEPQAGGDRTSARILVAEDNAVNQLLALTMLKKMGHTAIAVGNGREALEALRLSPYDLILMDCQMPEVDGFEATQRIRAGEAKTGGRVPIIALTANAMSEDRDRCLAAGMDDFVTKPVKRAALHAAIERWRVPPAVDVSHVRALVEAVGEGGLDEILGMFLRQIPERLAAMTALLAQGDVAALGAAAHSIKSSSGEFGAKRLMTLLDRLEAACAASAPAATLGELLTAAAAEWQRVERHFNSASAAA